MTHSTNQQCDAHRIGTGLKVALAALGEPAAAVIDHWRRLDDDGLLELELSARAAPSPVDALFDESRPATRWRAYGRTGRAIALLRDAARAAQHRH